MQQIYLLFNFCVNLINHKSLHIYILGNKTNIYIHTILNKIQYCSGIKIMNQKHSSLIFILQFTLFNTFLIFN